MTDAEKIAAFNKMQEEKKNSEVGALLPLRLDIGCGKNKKEGFIGLDQYAMEGVDWVVNLNWKHWVIKPDVVTPTWGDWEHTLDGRRLSDNSVDEVHCSHFIEHLTAIERVRFMNELYRVMKPGAKATLIAPHWASNRAYGDFTHQWPPIAEMWFYYLSKEWRKTQAPHNDKEWNPDGYDCDFEAGWGYSYHPALNGRNQEFIQEATTFKKEACQDIFASLTKK